MKAVLDDALFAAGAPQLALLSLFDTALDGRHRVALREEDGPLFAAWCAGQSQQTREEIAEALENGRDEARTPSKRVVSVRRILTSDWTARPPVLTLADAKALLSLPFWIMPENWSTDYAFLLAACTEEQRRELQRSCARGWTELQNGGGLTDMLKRINELKASDSMRCLTMWVLFDSDARARFGRDRGDATARGKPSPQSRDVFGACGKRIPCHQLLRRTIENYVPRRALEAWARRKKSAAMENRVQAFYKMPEDEQRHYFPMKEGLLQDARSKESFDKLLYGELYGHLDSRLRKNLETGFGGDLRDVFSDEDIRIGTADLLRDGSFKELNEAIADLLGWMK